MSLLSLLSLTLLCAPAVAGEGDQDDPLFEDEPAAVGSVRRAGAFGLGLGAGTSSSGLSLKLWANERMAVQAVVGAAYEHQQVQHNSLVDTSSGWQGGLGLSVDLLREGNSFAELDDIELGWSAGGSLGLWETGHLGLAAGGVLGLEFGFLTVPIDLVLEYRPRVTILPDPAVQWFGMSGHIRWYL